MKERVDRMTGKGISTRGLGKDRDGRVGHRAREVPIQVMVPEGVRRQVALMGADRGENIRTLVLRGLRAIGIDVPESEMGERRGRRHDRKGGGNGAQ